MGPRVPFAPALLTSSLLITLHIYFMSSLLFILFIIRVMVNKAVKKKKKMMFTMIGHKRQASTEKAISITVTPQSLAH